MKKVFRKIFILIVLLVGIGSGWGFREAFGMDFETEVGNLPGTVVAKTMQTIYKRTYTDEYDSMHWRPIYWDVRWYGYQVDAPIYTFEGRVYDLEMNESLHSFYVLTPDQAATLLLGCIKDY